MDIILLERVEKLGQMGDVVSVKPGYARNFLLPQGKAQRATKANLAEFEAGRVQLEAANLDRRNDAQAAADKMDNISVVLIRAASEASQLYGSVNSRDIADAVSAAGYTVTRSQVVMDRPAKSLGIFDYRIRLHPEVSVNVAVNIAQSQEEAEAQAERVARGEPAVLSASDLDAREAAEEGHRQAAAIAAAQAEAQAEEEAAAAEAESESEEA
jgi:large subunit ribosomal protein L9